MKLTEQYVVQSLELHLFFARIMKEHALFLEAGFTPAGAAFAEKADCFKRDFEKLLSRAVALGNGVVSKEALCAGEIITEFTPGAECKTEMLTGIHINRDITAAQCRLRAGDNLCVSKELVCQVQRLNREAMALLDGLICFKEQVLSGVLSCRMFTMNYPLLIEHILREAKLYREYLMNLENSGSLNCQSQKQVEQFWNRIMMEHAMFIRGLLDPCEDDLIDASDGFAKDYARLLACSKDMHERTMQEGDVLAETIKFRDFKAAGAEGIQCCKIRSIILPLLADHVLREANHYIRILES